MQYNGIELISAFVCFSFRKSLPRARHLLTIKWNRTASVGSINTPITVLLLMYFRDFFGINWNVLDESDTFSCWLIESKFISVSHMKIDSKSYEIHFHSLFNRIRPSIKMPNENSLQKNLFVCDRREKILRKKKWISFVEHIVNRRPAGNRTRWRNTRKIIINKRIKMTAKTKKQYEELFVIVWSDCGHQS